MRCYHLILVYCTDKHSSHYLKTKYPSVIMKEIERFIQAINNDGLLLTVYEELPWWQSIFTLDGIITLWQHYSI